MKFRRGVVYAIVLGSILFPIRDAFACGEKFLIVGRGSRFQRGYVALHPASLVVLNTHVTARKELHARLKLAGHRIQLVSDTAQLSKVMSSGRYDLVLADVNDAAEVDLVLMSKAPNSLFLPVIDGSSKEQLATAAKHYDCLLQDQGRAKNRDFLASIDSVMESRQKGKPLKCNLK